ncbi:testis-expressed protein 47-like isoform X1 [Schistocerca americana]|uniref:testis-expressed protein 47-like isoform X1 n=1 Tax=Schistocerca americana TaxID=7009 RepID=UPI001F4F147B|nr:testis-expressed protein 47-like isoform X1 [Schistocerca americana]
MEERRSLYNVIKENLAAAGRRTFLHRMIYIGRHNFEDQQAITQFFEATIKTINGGYCDEPLTGLFLWYNDYFIHVLEGSEETLNRHLKFLLKQIEASVIAISAMKILLMYHHIKQRFFQQWIARPVNAHFLPECISLDCDRDKTAQLLQTCVGKLYQLAELLQKQTVCGLQLILDHLSERVPHLLPEMELMEFLLSVSWLHDPQYLISHYATLPCTVPDTELELPAATDFVPYNVLYTTPEAQD